MSDGFFWAYLIWGIPAIPMIKWRLSASLQICALMLLFGTIIKYCVSHDFYAALIGQILIGLTPGFLYSTPGTFAYRWFSEPWIPTVMSVLFYSTPLGAALGYVIPALMDTPIDTFK
jgi:predicted MFS family arabinose efflux permease